MPEKEKGKQRKKKHGKKKYSTDETEPWMNDTFAYIAGYTNWGFPYGLTWEESGIDSSLPMEEKLRKRDEKEKDSQPDYPDDIDLPF